VPRPIFHLAFPVSDLESAREFYTGVLGGRLGRSGATAVDVELFGHQLTLHQIPGEVPPPGAHGVRHFGIILPWPEWQAFAQRLQDLGVTFESEPRVTRQGSPEEQEKMLLRDPSGNGIEIKAYRDVETALRLPGIATPP
jgi:uncharacterized protein